MPLLSGPGEIHSELSPPMVVVLSSRLSFIARVSLRRFQGCGFCSMERVSSLAVLSRSESFRLWGSASCSPVLSRFSLRRPGTIG